ncbi:MAG: hypothetical protein K9K67_15935 [Bacteriovoracaceae bacterium]|nr:hypothetical protein [Bacteriovoracaceae bacterium]
MEDDKLVIYIHDIINKSVSAQGYLKILSKSELGNKEAELLESASECLRESIEIIKSLRKDIR